MRTSQDTGFVWLVNTIIKSCLVFMMMAIASLTMYQIIMRYGLSKSSSWSEEAIRFAFIWCSFLAVSIGIREKIHIGINIVVQLFSDRVQRIIEILSYMLIVAFASLLVFYGARVVSSTQFQSSPALGIPMSWVYLSVPTMGALVIFYSTLEIVSLIKGFKKL
ncbi:MAG: TRAP transporter small permease [Natronospirillum sp.]|uniref:TRAP transporter small permease n=1 Tax=Natronospirillum sp. TaxID=2812955 RepID=UPI0025F7D8AA|nr:TRAP transporter small permease [Natronospirillum sp.]MCH8551903.1 TRAP transporter small permease [Natronospirillum sp.]